MSTEAPKNIFYAQSGGATAVINATACGVIQTARQYPQYFSNVLVGRNGIKGALNNDLIDTRLESDASIAQLKHTPSSAFGSCRYKLKSLSEDRATYEKIIETFAEHNIGYFFYNGGGDSQDTTYKISQMSAQMNYPLVCIGLPKTIDNDLPITDNCPGFGSVAKYVAVSTMEAARDVAGMAHASTQVFILEVMGRHTGWIAAASGLATQSPNDAPHIILFPEIAFDAKAFLQKVRETVATVGYCVIVVSEGIRDSKGAFITDSQDVDAFGHHKLGGVAPTLANLIGQQLKLKYHWAVADYLQRAARHIASQVDVAQAYAVGQSAVEYAMQGKSDVMLTIERLSNTPYQWQIGSTPLKSVANVEKKLPNNFISADGYHITDDCRQYLAPLIAGEAYPPYRNGLPDYARLLLKSVSQPTHSG